MTLRFNLAGAQFVQFEEPEYSYVNKPIKLVAEKGNKFDDNAISVKTMEGEHIGYVPKDGRKFQGQKALRECLIFNIPITGVVTEALYRGKTFCHISQARIEKAEAKGKSIESMVKGEFVDFQVELQIDAGDSSPTYHDDDGKEYLRLTKILGMFDWDPEDTGLDEWSHNCFKDYEEYKTFLNSCAVDGQIIHHKAEMAVYKQELPEGVVPLHKPIVDIVKRIRKVIQTEQTLYDDDIDVAGTPDAVVELKRDPEGYTTVLDWKRSKQCQPKYLRQVAFYAHGVGSKRAVIVLSRNEEHPYITLDEKEIEKYYNEVANLAMFVHSLKGE